MAVIFFQSTTTQHPLPPCPVGVDSHQFSFIEPQPLTLRLKLALSPPSPPTTSSELVQTGAYWDFSEIPRKPFFNTTDSISPLSSSSPTSSSSSFVMSDRSLELCTEDLGNETGCSCTADINMTQSNELFSSVSSQEDGDPSGNSNSPRRAVSYKTATAEPRSFPPPLTTISGKEAVQCRPHREGGRLIIEAVKTPMAHNILKADRSEGRVRLCFIDSEQGQVHEPDKPIECREMSQEEKEEEEWKNDQQKHQQQQQGGKEDENDDIDCRGGDWDENNEKLKVKIGNEEIVTRASRRCVSGEAESISKNKLFDWRHFLVATSS